MYSAPALAEHHDNHPHAYYATEVTDPTADLARDLRRLEYQLFTTLLPHDDTDIDIFIRTTQRLTGKGPRQIDSCLSAVRRLNELPLLREIQDTTHRLDLTRLIAIDTTLAKLTDDALIPALDEKLALYLLPTRANQALPTAGAIRRRLKDWMRMLAPRLDVDAEPAPEDPPRLHVDHDVDGRSQLYLDAATDDALIIEHAIRTHARKTGCTEGEALRQLITQAATVTVTLNVYRAHDVAGAPAFVFGAGWLTPRTGDCLAERASVIRDMDDTATKVSRAYHTPDDIRAFVVGRDGTCRGPGDDSSAEHAQMDHSVDFAAGGPTSADNLCSLCAHCHNVKTDGRMYPIRLPEGEIIWLFEDGTWVHNEPEGPLSRKARNWVQTLGQRITARRDRLKAPLKPEKTEEVERTEEAPTEQPDF